MAGDAKQRILQQQGSFNPRPQAVTDPLFLKEPFFDPRDLVQVKYEMLRRVQSEGHSVTQAVAAFGFSRPSFYQALAAFKQGGLGGSDPSEAWSQSGAQTHRRGAAIRARATGGGPRAASPGAGAPHCPAFRCRRSPAQHRARLGAQSKKTPGGA